MLHHTLPDAPWMDPRTARLPGMLPVAPGDWIRVDEAFAGQMALRDHLIATRAGAVQALTPPAVAAAGELLDLVVEMCATLPGYAVGQGAVTRPDGVRVTLDRAAPLLTLGRLVQADFCILTRDTGAEHLLTGAILCFPASWTLAQKIGRPLTAIHTPVPRYDAGIAARVQRLFDGVRVGAPLWRANAMRYADPALHQPRREGEVRPRPAQRPYLRSERQTLVRLPESGAVVFSIHTIVLPFAALSQDVQARFLAWEH